MGFLDGLFPTGQKNEPRSHEPLTIYAPAGGEAVALEKFPDPVFSQGVLGPGCGIIPSTEQIVAPFDGIVIQLQDTLHAIGLKSDDGIELLIHIGVDTVDMNGKGFSSDVKMGQKVLAGKPLISFDREAIRMAEHADAVAVIVTNADEFAGLEILANGALSSGAPLLRVRKKE